MYSIVEEGMRARRVEPAGNGTAETPVLLGADATRAPDVSLVIPTKNEAEGIERCIERAIEAFETLGLTGEVIVSDSSTDATAEIASEHGARVVEPDRVGYGYAYQYAFERARGEYIAMGDGDATYDFRELPRLVERLESSSADVVLGNRMDGDIKPGAMPALHRYVGNPVLTGVLNAFYDAGVADAHSGMRVFHRDLLEAVSFESDGMEFASEMIMAAGEAGLTIEEVPITYHPREGEPTIHTFRDGWRHLKFMLANAPSHLFGAPSATLLLAGATLVLAGVGLPSLGVAVPGVSLAVVGAALLLVGAPVGALALTSTRTGEAVRPPGDPVTRAVQRGFTLERGLLLAGTLVAVVPAAIAAGPLSAPATVAAGVAGLLGVQTAFYAFFLYLLFEEPTVAIRSAADRAPTTGGIALEYEESEAD